MIRVTLTRWGAQVEVETLAQVAELLELLHPKLSIEIAPPAIEELARRMMADEVPTAHVGPEAQPPRPRLVDQPRADTSADAQARIEAGLLELLKVGPRRVDDLATGANMGRTTVLEYLKRLAAAGRCHQAGRGPATRWVIGADPKGAP